MDRKIKITIYSMEERLRNDEAYSTTKRYLDGNPSRNEDALVSGNGSHGVMVFGDPIKDTIVGNHCRLYLPQGNSDQLPEMAPYLDKVREIIRTKGYEEAIAYYYRKSTELGYEGLTMSDPYHPGFHLFIETDHHNYSRYRRSIDYETGELQVSYQVNHQSYRRKTFVSQTNNAIIHELSPANYHISLKQYVDKKNETANSHRRKCHSCTI